MISLKWGVDRSIVGYTTSEGEQVGILDMKAVGAELVGMFLFVVIGCGAACAHGGGDIEARISLAFAFGMAIMVIAYAIGHHSGGHINCAVSFSLVLGGHVPWYQGLANTIAQMIGSVLGAALLALMFPCNKDMTGNLGSNIANDNYSPLRILVCEAFGTFLLCFTVWETAVTPQASCGKNAVIAIGFSVFLAHCLLLPVDGCSINPTRSFGPALVSYLRSCDNYTPGGLQDLWMFWIGPLMGAAIAAAVQKPFAPELDRLKRLEEAAKEWLRAQKLLERSEDSAGEVLKPEDVTFDTFDAEEQTSASKRGFASKCLNLF
jgi:MIP family channel proteins